MRSLMLIWASLCFGLPALAATATRHPSPENCYAIQVGLDNAAGLAWTNDTIKATQLREPYESVRFHAHLLANSLRSGASLESTREVQMELIRSGKAFRDRAAALRVQIPDDSLNQYLSFVQRCIQPYNQ